MYWYNHHRIHSSLGYQTPIQYKENNLKFHVLRFHPQFPHIIPHFGVQFKTREKDTYFKVRHTAKP
ncbi:MAG: hypothetical protein HFG39_13550 [Lachnospiraceae bacterium]|nr:hypothetical protein [Lachnospiraceae bacterium]